MTAKNIETKVIGFTTEFMSDADVEAMYEIMRRARKAAGDAAANKQYDRYDEAQAWVGSVMQARTERSEAEQRIEWAEWEA